MAVRANIEHISHSLNHPHLLQSHIRPIKPVIIINNSFQINGRNDQFSSLSSTAITHHLHLALDYTIAIEFNSNILLATRNLNWVAVVWNLQLHIRLVVFFVNYVQVRVKCPFCGENERFTAAVNGEQVEGNNTLVTSAISKKAYHTNQAPLGLSCYLFEWFLSRMGH